MHIPKYCSPILHVYVILVTYNGWLVNSASESNNWSKVSHNNTLTLFIRVQSSHTHGCLDTKCQIKSTYNEGAHTVGKKNYEV